MQYYDEVQEVNERRKRRILAYYEYMHARCVLFFQNLSNTLLPSNYFLAL